MSIDTIQNTNRRDPPGCLHEHKLARWVAEKVHTKSARSVVERIHNKSGRSIAERIYTKSARSVIKKVHTKSVRTAAKKVHINWLILAFLVADSRSAPPIAKKSTSIYELGTSTTRIFDQSSRSVSKLRKDYSYALQQIQYTNRN